jgi:hypothetical protein
MADEERRQRRHSTRHGRRGKRHASRKPPEPSFFRRFWFEILAFLFLGLGIFLLVERLEIKVILWRWILRVGETVAAVAAAIGSWFADNVLVIRTSDLAGITLIFIALSMIAVRLRGRAIARHPPPVLKQECPKCQADMVRAPRRLSHRLLEYLLWIRIRRYGCTKCSYRTASWHRLREEDE